jgi:hypothetical protein
MAASGQKQPLRSLAAQRLLTANSGQSFLRNPWAESNPALGRKRALGLSIEPVFDYGQSAQDPVSLSPNLDVPSCHS